MPFPNGWWVAETTMATGLSVQRERQRRRGQEAEQVYVYHFHWNAAMDDKTSLNLLLPPCPVLGKSAEFVPTPLHLPQSFSMCRVVRLFLFRNLNNITCVRIH